MEKSKILEIAIFCNSVYAQEKVTALGDIVYPYKTKDGTLVIAIAGTHDSEDVISDLKFWPSINGSDAGFQETWSRVKVEVKKLVIDSTGFILAGHSLGGAVAQIGAAELAVDCVSFGAPKPWFSLNFGHRPKTHLRVVDHGDPVPTLPPFPLYKTWSTETFWLGDDDSDYSIKNHSILTYIQNLSE